MRLEDRSLPPNFSGGNPCRFLCSLYSRSKVAIILIVRSARQIRRHDAVRSGPLLRLFLCVAIVFSGFLCRAVPGQQDYLVDVWNVDHGLPQGSVMHVAQTPEGYLWIATFWQGIARFDGVRFVNYTAVTTPELPDPEGWRLLVDSRGTLWINSLQGSLTSWRAGQFTLEFKRQARIKSLVLESGDQIVFATHDGALLRGPAIAGADGAWETFRPPGADGNSQFAADAEGVIWYVRGDMRLGRWVDGEFELMETTPGLSGRAVRALITDINQRLWVGTDREIAVWNGKAFESMTPTNGEPNLAVLRMAFSGKGDLWVEADGTLRRCRDRRWLAECNEWTGQFGPSGDPVLMHGDSEGGVWFTHVGDGLIHVKPDGTLRRLNTRSGMPNNLTRCWLEDREGNIWTGSERGGLVRVRPRFFHSIGKAHGLTDPIITSVAEDAEGAIWCGSQSGMIYRRKDERWESFELPLQGTRSRCATIFPAADGRLWIGTSGNGVLLRSEGRFAHILTTRQIDAVARATLADRNGRLWVGNERGLYCWDGETVLRLGTDAVALAEAPDGAIWAGNSAGELCRIEGDVIARFSPADDHPLSRIWALLVERDGTVWAATDGAGLLRFRDGAFARFTTRDGLPGDTIFQLLDDEQGRLWLGVRSGLACAAKAAFEDSARGVLQRIPFQVYGRYDGLHTLELCSSYQPACWRGRDGRLWFATANGVVWVQPAELRLNPLPPPVIIEEVRVDGKAVEVGEKVRERESEKGKAGLRPVSLSHLPTRLVTRPGRHMIEFQFTGLSFTAPDKVRFRWRLEGLDSDWVDGDTEVRKAVYNLVPPGDYQFRVQACNNDGVWNETGAALALRIPEFFWKTGWFLGLCGFVGAASLAGWVRHVTRQRMQRRLERLEQQRSIERERTRIAQDLHDDLGASLTEISMLASSGHKTNGENGDSLAEIAQRSNHLVRAMDEIVWAVNPRHDSVVSLAEYLSAHARDFLGAAGIRARLDVQRGLPSLPLNPDQRHELFHAVKEAIRNAARHAQASEVWLRIKVEDQRLILRVEDDGRGFEASSAPGGNGLHNMRERLARLGGSFDVRNANAKGTVVELSLPLE